MNRTFLLKLDTLMVVAFRSDCDSDLYFTLNGYLYPNPPPGFSSNNVVGVAQFELDTDGLLFASVVMVDASFQRQRIATSMYNYIEACYNTKVKPAKLQTAQAEAFWKERNTNKMINNE